MFRNLITFDWISATILADTLTKLSWSHHDDCVKIKRYSLEMMGEKWKWSSLVCCKGSMSLSNMTLIRSCVRFRTSSLSHLPSWVWKIHFSSHLIVSLHHHELWSYVEPNSAKLWSRVTNKFKRSIIYSSLPLIHCLIFCHSPRSLIYSTTSFVSCWWCWIHYGPPSMDHFLLNSAHYRGRWSRKSLLVPWSLHASMTFSSHPTIGLHH